MTITAAQRGIGDNACTDGKNAGRVTRRTTMNTFLAGVVLLLGAGAVSPADVANALHSSRHATALAEANRPSPGGRDTALAEANGPSPGGRDTALA